MRPDTTNIFMNQFNHIAASTSKTFQGLLLFLCVLGFSNLSAQGWERYIGGNDFDELFDVVQSRDQGFIATGYIDESKIAVLRLDPEGNTLWVRETFDATAGGQGHAIIESNDGSIYLVGSCNACGFGEADLFIVKLNQFGETQWTKAYGGPQTDEGWDIIEANDGTLAVAGSYQDGAFSDVYFLKIDPTDGTTLIDKKYNGINNRDDQGFAIAQSSDDQNFVITGSTDFASNETYTFLLKVSAVNGDTIWTKTFDNGTDNAGMDIVESINVMTGLPDGYAITGSFNNNDIFFLKTDLNGLELNSTNYGDAGADQGNAIIQTTEGGYLIAGTDELSGLKAFPTLIKIDSEGFKTWAETYGNSTGFNFIAASARGLTANEENGYTIVGFRSDGIVTLNKANAFAIKVDTSGKLYTNILQGRVFFDFDDDCEMDLNEFGFENWNIVAKGNDQTFYQTSDFEGNFSIPVADGDYEVSMVPPSEYWSACTNAINVSLNNPYDSTTLNFPVQVNQLCSYLEVDASAPYLSPCNSTDYYISYCNKGTDSAQDAYIIIDLDPNLTLTGSTQNFTSLGDNSYRFELGNIAISASDSFRVSVFVDCASIEGQTHCFEAHIHPDTLCTPVGNWDGSSLALEAACNGNQVDLRVRNIGAGDMTNLQGYVIIEDDVMLRPPGPLQIKTGKDSIFSFPANGSTYRIIMEQAEGHPGRSMPTAAIEGCVDGGGSFSTGFYTMFAENDANNFLVKDCQESFPSTETPSHSKRGFPKGYGEDKLITPETELKYVLTFENNGLDTAIRMVIRDTLSTFLDPTSVRPGASSHDFTYEVTGEGILKFTFEDIHLLPNGGTNSSGFVKYSISQKPNNPAGALIKNGAAIFYDYGHPNYTENTCHKIEDFVRVSTNEIFHPAVQGVKVYPNPFVETATVEIVGTEHFGAIKFVVFDTNGKMVYRQEADGPIFTISRNDLPAGFYFYQLEANAQLISSGKVVIQ